MIWDFIRSVIHNGMVQYNFLYGGEYEKERTNRKGIRQVHRAVVGYQKQKRYEQMVVSM